MQTTLRCITIVKKTTPVATHSCQIFKNFHRFSLANSLLTGTRGMHQQQQQPPQLDTIGNSNNNNNNHKDTPAIQFLQQHQVNFTIHEYEYLEKGGTLRSSQALNVDEHHVVKTLVFEADKQGIIVLMHGDCKVDTTSLAKQIGAKKVKSCSPDAAFNYTGYMVGGTSPFGTKNKLPIYLQKSILDIQQIYINGGDRGYLVCLPSHELVRVLNPVQVDAAKK